MAIYSGTSRGNPYLVDDPNGGDPIWHEGDMEEISPSTRPSPYWSTLLKHLPMIFGPGLGAAALEALATPGVSALFGFGGGGGASSVLPSSVPAATAPTAGSLGSTSGLLSAGGKVLSSVAQGMTNNRAEEAQNQYARDQFTQQGERDAANNAVNRANVEVTQRGDAREAENQAFRNALRSALALHAQDANPDLSQFHADVPRIDLGGLRPSMLGEEGLAAAAALNKSATQALLEPPAYMTPEPYERTTPAETPKASIWERLAGPISAGLTAAGALRPTSGASAPKSLFTGDVPRPGGPYA